MWRATRLEDHRRTSKHSRNFARSASSRMHGAAGFALARLEVRTAFTARMRFSGVGAARYPAIAAAARPPEEASTPAGKAKSCIQSVFELASDQTGSRIAT